MIILEISGINCILINSIQISSNSLIEIIGNSNFLDLLCAFYMTDFIKLYKKYYFFAAYIVIEMTNIFSCSILTYTLKKVVYSNNSM